MRYVILRDDDTSALTPVRCLERLYRPFLDRGLPVNLATIPKVRSDVVGPDGFPESYLHGRNELTRLLSPVGANQTLTSYLRGNPGYHIVQHGYHHSLFEFDSDQSRDIAQRLDDGARLLMEAGFAKPQTFVAPYDRLSRSSLIEVARRFRVLSTGWFEWRRLPASWWPRYALKKVSGRPHWRRNGTALLSHPGCLLSHQRPYATMLAEVKKTVLSRRLTVLVTHWWEYFPNDKPDETFIDVLHETAAWLGGESQIKVVSFDDVAKGAIPLD